MDLQALLDMFLASEAAEGDTKDIFTGKIQALAAEKGFNISDDAIAQGLALMQKLYGQYQRGEEMDLASVAAAFMGGEDNGLAQMASMFMGDQAQGQGADMMQLMSMLNGAEGQQGADIAQMASMFMGAQGQDSAGNDDLMQMANMFLNNK